LIESAAQNTPPSLEGLDAAFIEELRRICGPRAVLAGKDETIVYECDAFTIDKHRPSVVVLPTSTEQVAAVVKAAHARRVPFLARGAGTGLAGGVLPRYGGLVIAMNRMKRILEVDLRNRRMVVEAGCVNISLSRAVAEHGYQYAPDPSSQMSCTIGGNVSNNSGGPHTLKYGVTVNHVVSLKMVLPNGEIVEVGGKVEDSPGYDLTGLLVGTEGTFGVVTEVTVRMVRLPQAVRTMLAVFDSIDDATNTVSGIIAAGIVPAALEMMDQLIIQAVEAAFHFGFPTDAQACLIVELDGFEAGLDRQAERVKAICARHHAREVRAAAGGAERDALWKARKRAIGAAGRLAPSNCTQDGVIPRTKLPQVLREIAAIAERYGVRVANVFHAGDGNLHPVVLFDERDPDEVRRVLDAGSAILRACVDAGGSITGEHGIGVEKIDHMPYIFSPTDLDTMARLKAVFNPDDLCNPGKMLPTSKGCVEVMLRARSVAL
jgi:glycolate dehydrogenase FAD-linked subunit